MITSKIRVLQLIDSLRPGGAERMAISYANALVNRVGASYLCSTRMEGLLKGYINPQVGFLFLRKKSKIDPQAILRLRNFIISNRINVIQAHSSSFFLATIVKALLPSLKLIWHDHYGLDLSKRKVGLLKPASFFFSGIISVNRNLVIWAGRNLLSKKIIFFQNFISDSYIENVLSLKLFADGTYKIICLANLRPQKDHLNLVKAFELLNKDFNNISLHLIGKDEHDIYSKAIKNYIFSRDLEKKVYFYGEQQNVYDLLRQADLGVLSSLSEGLPVALLEYGKAGLPVVSTGVGEIPEVIGTNGTLVPPQDPLALAKALLVYIKDTELQKIHSTAFQNEVKLKYSEEAVLPNVVEFYEKIFED